ncbi:MAG TPA: LamG-like jellyroll fold domain-containing protein, partial [Phycisphaerales bacterium]|nr:LamG-like jellyroll fold domain-containing protein [Phycisphaerales bacterium]
MPRAFLPSRPWIRAILPLVACAAPGAIGVGPALAQSESVVFTGPASLRADSPAAEAIAPQQFTIEAWFRADGPGSGFTNDGAGAVIVNKPREGTIGPNLASWGLHWLPATNRVLFYITNVFGVSGAGLYSSAVIPPGTLTHCAGTFDGTTLRLYINGQLDNTAVAPSPTVYYATDMPIVIGAGNFGLGYARNFQGLIDEVRIWDHVRTAAEIAAAFDCPASVGTGPRPGLLARWMFDGGSLTDSAGGLLPLSVGGSPVSFAAEPAPAHACSNEVAAPGNCIPTVELVASDRAVNDHYGWTVAISGDTAAVGAPAHVDAATSSGGAVYVFARSGASWPQQAKIVVPG